jgi:hypothetical protein
MLMVWLISYGQQWITANYPKFETPMDYYITDKYTLTMDSMVKLGWLDCRVDGDCVISNGENQWYRLSDKTIKELSGEQ